MTEPVDPIEADKTRAQGIVDAMRSAADLIEADSVARTGRGGPVQVIADQKHPVLYAAWRISQAFDLPWDGPSYPAIPAVPVPAE